VTEIPESLLRRSAEAKAKALGLPVEQVLAEMKGEAPPTPPPAPEPAPVEPSSEEELIAETAAAADRSEAIEEAVESAEEQTAPVEEVPAADAAATAADEPEVVVNGEADVAPAAPTEAPVVEAVEEPVAEAAAEAPAETAVVEPVAEEPVEAPAEESMTPAADAPAGPAPEVETEAEPAAAVTTAVEDKPVVSGNGSGNGKPASVVTARPVVPPKGVPEGVRTQRLLTVVKARAIQTVKTEPTDKVNTWPHLMLMEFGALLAITGLLVIMSVIIHSPLLDPANFNATPNPSKAPWYFLGLQELLSYFDPQIAGVMVPTITGMIGFMMVPFVDKNPSTRPSDRKFAIALYSLFLAGAATLTIIGVLFRGRGFNFSYPWKDGVFFDDLKDWVHFE
jgi:menaquinol-cytochrome c reductase cytochrome b/c subunit